MSVEIKEVKSKKELKQFVKFNIELYKDCPYHVPGIIEEEMVTLSRIFIRLLSFVKQSIFWRCATTGLWAVLRVL